MHAQLNLNTQQAYRPFYDEHAAGKCLASQSERYSENDAKCDQRLEEIFGGDGALVSTGFDPSTLRNGKYKNGSFRFPDHSAAPDGKGQGGIIHLYTNKYGTEATVGVYAPSLTSGDPKVVPFTQYYLDPKTKTYTDEVINIGVRVEYSTGLQISFSHVSSSTGKDSNGYGFQIGNIAGAGTGGDGDGYNHSHIQFTQNIVNKRGKVTGRRRVDPRAIFCKEFGF